MIGVCLKCSSRPQITFNARQGGYKISCKCGSSTLWYTSRKSAEDAWNGKNSIKVDTLLKRGGE